MLIIERDNRMGKFDAQIGRGNVTNYLYRLIEYI